MRHNAIGEFPGCGKRNWRAEIGLRLSWSELDIGVRISPDKRETCQKILGVDCLPGASIFFRTHNSSHPWKLRAGDFSSDRAGSDLDDGVVADAFALSQLAVGHEINLVVVFGKPDGCVYGRTIFPKGREADVFLTVDFRWDVRHPIIVKCIVECGEEVLCRGAGMIFILIFTFSDREVRPMANPLDR